MKKSLFFLGIVCVSVVAGMVYFSKEQLNIVRELNFKPFTYTVGENNQVQGWGFRKLGPGIKPEFTQEQIKAMQTYNGIYVCEGDTKQVVLTFDLGYEKGYTKTILDILKSKNTKAIFFVTGSWLKENPDTAKRIVAEGHIIGNHTYNHPCLAQVDRETFDKEILDLEREIISTTGQNNSYKFLRPPKGEYNDRSLSWTKELGYTTVFWSVALKDWVPLPSSQVVVNEIKKQLHPGAVLLLHGVSREVTEALPEVIDYIKSQEYVIISIDKLKF